MLDNAASRLPPRSRKVASWLLSRWLGRVLTRCATTSIRIELFDRSMTIAAQFFTSVFPLLIIAATWLESHSGALAEAVHFTEQVEEMLDDAMTSGDTTFGLVSVLIVLISATSLSRALTRAFAAIWQLARPKTRLNVAWRWVAVVLALAGMLVALNAVTGLVEDVPPRSAWAIAAATLAGCAVGVFVPWMLLAGQLQARLLLPGALVFSTVMLFVRPAAEVWLPHALEASADHYGAIGVAFTYLAWLYCVAFCFLAAHILGQVIATDEGWLGRLIRGPDRPGAAPADHGGTTPPDVVGATPGMADAPVPRR